MSSFLIGSCNFPRAWACKTRFSELMRGAVIPSFLLASTVFAKQEITVDLSGGANMDFVWIEPGMYKMGSASSEWERQESEGPQHEVSISHGFYLGKTEVTQGQWKSVMGTSPWMDNFTGNGFRDQFIDDPINPAIWISWSDAQSFMEVLNSKSGDSVYRLPTEAEWEYSARAGTTTMWPFGDEYFVNLKEHAWIWSNTAPLRSQPVATKLPNPWGLYNMHGNVEEWCHDWFGAYTIDHQVDPWGPQEGTNRVVRGGSFRTKGFDKFRVAYRYGVYDGRASNNIGFRVLMLAPESSVPTVLKSQSWGLIKAEQ